MTSTECLTERTNEAIEASLGCGSEWVYRRAVLRLLLGIAERLDVLIGGAK